MPVINFVVRDHKGQPIQNTSFKITSGVPDTGYEEGLVLPAATLVTTDSLGAFTATLVHTAAPYYLSKANNTTDEYVAYKFFVPNVTTELTAELLYVDVGLHQELLNDRSLAALIDAKVSVHNRATFMNDTMVSVLDALTTIATAEDLAIALWNDRGNYSAVDNTYPSSGGSGEAGAIRKGDLWVISVAGTLPVGQAVSPGDTVRSLVNSPGQTQANWAIVPLSWT